MEGAEPEVNMDDLDDAVGADSSELVKSIENNPGADVSQDVQSEQQEKTTKILDKMVPALGLDGPITEQTINDASQENPPTKDSKIINKVVENVQNDTSTAFKGEQEANGEQDKPADQSEKTKASFMEKYGKLALALAIAGALAGGIIALNQLAKSLSGCYQVLTTSSNYSTPTKIGCQQSQCTCSGVSSSRCASPDCGGSQGVNYYWNNMSDLQALAALPGIAASGIAQAAAGFTGSFGKSIGHLLLIGGAVIGVLGVLYMIYKFYLSKQISQEGTPAEGPIYEEGTLAPDIAIAKFKLRSNYKLKYM